MVKVNNKLSYLHLLMKTMVQALIVNPLMLVAAKNCLTVLAKSFKQKYSLETIWRRDVSKNTNNNSLSDIL